MELLSTTKTYAAIGPYSQAVKVNGLLYSSGQIPLTNEGEIVANDLKLQTRQIFKNIKALLEDNGSSMDEVIKLNIFLTDINDFGIVNVLMAEAFGDHKPVRTTMAVNALPKNSLIQMDVMASLCDFH